MSESHFSCIRKSSSVLILSAVLITVWCALPSPVSAQNQWYKISETGPSAREVHVMAYDRIRNRVVLFGGEGPQGVSGETWEWDGIKWKLVSTTGPSPRRRSAIAYDRARGRTTLFGGFDINAGLKGDTWEWDGISWTLVSTGATAAAPSPRRGHAMVYDRARGAVVLFGGNDPVYKNDTWEWDGLRWTLVATTGPSGRNIHSMAYDSDRSVVVLFGGFDDTPAFFGDTWEWDGAGWTQVSSTGPSRRRGHAMAFDTKTGITLLFGGNKPDLTYHGDTWTWDGSTWTQVATTGPSSRWGHGMVYHSKNGYFLLFGGYDGDYRGDTWIYGPAYFDLAILKVKAQPKTLGVSDKITLIARVKNNGPKTSAFGQVNFFLSADNVLDAVDTRIAWVEHPPVKNKKTKRVKTTVALPATVSAGSYYLIASFTDADLKADNNVKVAKKTIVIY